MKLTQLSTCEFKLDSVSDFCLNSQGNQMTLIGNSNDATIMELMHSLDGTILMPYNNKQISITQDKPINHIMKHIDLVQIYETGNVQETQELALDPIYIAECSSDPLKSRVLQVEIVPLVDTNLCCILTTYGMCEMFQKTSIIGDWQPLNTNLSNILLTDVFPAKVPASPIKTYVNLKSFVTKYIITCFTISQRISEIIIYVGTAAGYVIALQYIEKSKKFEKYCLLKTPLNRISYIAIYNNLLLVGCEDGQVRLVKINHEERCLYDLEYLWSKQDRMTCRKAVFTFCKQLESYLVVFCKAAHVLAYRLDLDGVVLSSSTLYVSGIKVSGLESISENEFIITTILGTVKYIKIVCPTKEELNIEDQVVEHEFDTVNLQILGVAASISRNLWSFILYRNKEYVTQSKYSSSTAFLSVCKLSSENSFSKLINLNLRNMNMAQDLVMAINLDIFNNMELDVYLKYLDLENLQFPNHLNDAFLQKLQIKLIILRKLALYQRMKYKKVKLQTENELQLLEPSIQLLHILGRLQYLKKNNTPGNKLSPFQELSIASMQFQFTHLLNKLVNINSSDGENKLRKTVDSFWLLAMDEFENNKFNTDCFINKTEYCSICNEIITNFEKCAMDHDIKRCTISYTQLSLFETLCCPQCFALARNDADANLTELFSKEEYIKCTYCRFLLK